MLWPPPMACVSAGPGSAAPRLGGSGPGAPHSPLRRILAPLGPLTCHAMDDSLSTRRLRLRSPGAGAARGVPCAPWPATACPRGACREVIAVRPSPDADDSQLPFLDPTQYRYELIGFDHGAGHPLLLLYDAKISRGKNVNNFNSLDYNPFIVSTSLFLIITKYT